MDQLKPSLPFLLYPVVIFVVATGSGRPANTCEAHRSRQFHCHSRRLFLSGTPAPASASCFLPEMCIGSPLPV